MYGRKPKDREVWMDRSLHHSSTSSNYHGICIYPSSKVEFVSKLVLYSRKNS